jgi:lipoyl(octanoyl) transferase
MYSVRLLPFASRTGPGNMATDDAMLHSAADRGIASFRFYTWDEPTLSLGYFQPNAERTHALWVRRATGGAAIMHDPATEITYSFALPAGKDWQPPGESWICKMHYTIRDVLAKSGVDARSVLCGQEQKLEPILCFQHQTAGDLLVNGRKVAGSAQRKHKGALLQHGSILFRQSPFAPSVPGILELAGVTVDPGQFMAEVVRTLDWPAVPGDWSNEELAMAAKFEKEKYSSDEWNFKR